MMRARPGFRALLGAGLAAALAVSACGDLDVVTASYRTLAEAREAGAIQRGWIPEGLPEGAYELREAHDLDTNRRWGLFNFPRQEAGTLQAILQEGETNLDGVTCSIPPRIEWWPVLLRGRLDPERIRSTGLQAYRAADGDLLFVVNWEQGRAYYWNADGNQPRASVASAGKPTEALGAPPAFAKATAGNLRKDGRTKEELVPRTGIEPVTPAFSVLCSTD